MACKKRKNLKELIEILVKDRLYKKDLKKKHFEIFLEILQNGKRKKLRHCFSKESRDVLKTNRSIVRALVDSNVSLAKRMRRLRKVPKSFRVAVKTVLHDFLSNCVECKD